MQVYPNYYKNNFLANIKKKFSKYKNDKNS